MRVLNRFSTEEEWAENELNFPDTSAVEEDFSMRFLVNPDDFVFEVSGGSSLELDIASGGTGETTVNVVSTQRGENVGFTVSEKPDWVTITTGETSITYQVPSNPDTVERSGNVKLVQEGSKKEITIAFTQAEGVFYEFNISGETSHSLSLEGEASSGSINVTSTKNGNLLGYTISGTPTWMTANRSSSNNALSYSVTDNYGGSQRSGVLNLVQDETSDRITVNVLQDYATTEGVAGQVVLWDASGETKLVIESDDYRTSTYPTSRYTPIGVVVIPSSHMDDGRARMMSLRWMNCDDPENGSLTAQGMVWGTETDLTGLTNFRHVTVITSVNNQEILGYDTFGYVPSNYSGFTTTKNPQDPGTGWDSVSKLIASPYASDGTPNPLYRATSYSGGSIDNAMSDFDGIENTSKILEARGRKNYDWWKPKYNQLEDFPAASCCYMYHTVGTNQGDWYLPSCGELGYVAARLNDINNTMAKVNGMQDLPTIVSWSSTESYVTLVWMLHIDGGRIENLYGKSADSASVVAFCPI